MDQEDGALRDELTRLAEIPIPQLRLPLGVAVQLVMARQQAADHAQLVAKHRDRVDTLRARLAERQAVVEEIATRRAGEDFHKTDAAELALADSDAERLRRMISEAEAETPAPFGGLRQAERVWAEAVADARRAAMKELSTAIEGALIGAADRLATACTGRSAAERYKPNARFATASSLGV